MKEFKIAPATTNTKLMAFGLICWMIFIFSVPSMHPPAAFILVFVAAGALQFLTRHVVSYRVTEEEICLRRLLWNTSFPKGKLLSATWDPSVFENTSRQTGTRGNWGHDGWFSSRRLGAFRAYVSDPRKSVVLRFSNQNIVVSPANPQAFIAALNVPSEAIPLHLPVRSGGGYFTGYW